MINPNVIHESAQHGRPISIRRSITLIVIGAGIGIVGIEAINAIRSRDISPKKAIGYVQGVPAHVQVASVDHAVSGNVHSNRIAAVTTSASPPLVGSMNKMNLRILS